MKKWKKQAPGFFKNYYATDTETFQKIIGNFEQEKEEQKATKTFAEADSIADYLSVASSAVINVGGSVVKNIGTLGTGYFMEFAADNFITANEVKAESQGKTLEELLKAGEADILAPVKIAGLQAGLEYIGFS